MNRTLLTLCVAALLVTAGCAGLTGDGGDDAPDAEQLTSDTIAAIQDADTYRMSMSLNLSASGQTFTITQEGDFDHEAEQARLDVTAYGVQSTAYMNGSTMYVKSNGRWQTQDFSEEKPWEAGNGVTQQVNILESGDVSVAGTAMVDGVETTILSVDSNEDELKQLLTQQGQSLDGVTIEDATYKLYVANDTHLPRKLEMTMEMSINGQTADAEVTATFSGYGEPVDITIPDAATQSDSSADRTATPGLAAV